MAWRQPSNHIETGARIRNAKDVRLCVGWYPPRRQRASGWEAEGCRRDADNRQRDPGNGHASSDNPAIAGKCTLPEFVAQDADCRSTRIRIRSGEVPPHDGRDTRRDRKFQVTSALSIACDAPLWTSVAGPGPVNPVTPLSVCVRSRHAVVSHDGESESGLGSMKTSLAGSWYGSGRGPPR